MEPQGIRVEPRTLFDLLKPGTTFDCVLHTGRTESRIAIAYHKDWRGVEFRNNHRRYPLGLTGDFSAQQVFRFEDRDGPVFEVWDRNGKECYFSYRNIRPTAFTACCEAVSKWPENMRPAQGKCAFPQWCETAPGQPRSLICGEACRYSKVERHVQILSPAASSAKVDRDEIRDIAESIPGSQSWRTFHGGRKGTIYFIPDFEETR